MVGGRDGEEGTGSALVFQWDTLDRLASLHAAVGDQPPEDTLAGYRYIGSSRLVQVDYGDGSVYKAASWDTAGRRLQGAVYSGVPESEAWFQEDLAYDLNDRVTRVLWPHGRTGSAVEAQTYIYDQGGRLTTFRQGLWNGSGIEGTPSAQHAWILDELGNWRQHAEKVSRDIFFYEVSGHHLLRTLRF